MRTAALPKAQSALADRAGYPTREWYTYFSELRNSSGLTPAQQQQLDELAARVTALEDGGSGGGSIQGIGSIVTQGSPPGIVQISLEGDTDTPGNTWYYGTAPDGMRGWWALSDGLAVTADLTKAVDGATGVTTFGLNDLPNSGTGTAIYKTTRDAKGRTSGQVSATTNDLPEGSANLYYTDARADARANAAVAAHVAQADPHPQYTTAAEAAAAAPVQSVNARTGAVSVPDYVVKSTAPTASDFGRALINGDRWFNDSNGIAYTYQAGSWITGAAAAPSNLSGVYSARPAANTVVAGSVYTATDVREQYRSDGSTWSLLPAAGVSLALAERNSSFIVTSTSPADVTGLTATILAGERSLRVTYGASMKLSGGAAADLFALSLIVNGSTASSILLPGASGNFFSQMRTTQVGPFTPGTNVTIKLQAFVTNSSSTGEIFGASTDRSFLEIANT